MKEIYVVEDDRDIRELIEFLLISYEFKVQSFPTAEDFMKGLSSHYPDLILLDIMLPDGNGIDICENLKKDLHTETIPVVLMSAHADKSILKGHYANDFIPKPFDIEDFIQRINRQLN